MQERRNSIDNKIYVLLTLTNRYVDNDDRDR